MLVGWLGGSVKFRVLCFDIELGGGEYRDNGSVCFDGEGGEYLVVGFKDEAGVLFL